MGRVWDIIPPTRRPKKTAAPAKKRSSQNAALFLGLLLIIILVFIFLNSLQNAPLSVNGLATSFPPTPTLDSNEILIKILNGSGHSEETETVAKILEEANFKIAKTESALNLYDQTIIYYQEPRAKQAQEMADILKKYSPKIQKFSQSTAYDLIIVIGAR